MSVRRFIRNKFFFLKMKRRAYDLTVGTTSPTIFDYFNLKRNVTFFFRIRIYQIVELDIYKVQGDRYELAKSK